MFTWEDMVMVQSGNGLGNRWDLILELQRCSENVQKMQFVSSEQ